LPTGQDPVNAENTPMQLTYNSVGTAGPVFYSFLPGGYLVYFGKISATNLNPQTITLSPVPSSLLIAIANPNTVESNGTHRPIKISTNITSPSTFNVYADFAPLASYDFSWFAIGVA
jgi:hypothetical protein